MEQLEQKQSGLTPEKITVRKTFPGHENYVVTCLHLDTDKIISASNDYTIVIWDLNGNRIRTLKGHSGGIWGMAVHDNLLLSGSTDKTVRVWDLQTGNCLYVFEGHSSTVRCMYMIPPKTDEEEVLFATGSRDKTIRVRRIPSGKIRSSVTETKVFKSTENPYLLWNLTGHTQSVRAIAGDENVLISGSYDNSVRIWDLKSGKCRFLCTGHTDKVYAVDYSVDLGICVSSGMDTTTRVWDVNTGSCLHVLEGHTILVGLLAIFDDYVLSAGADSVLKIWNVKDGACLATLTGHKHAITCFHVDKNLNRIISGSESGVKLWQLFSEDEKGQISNTTISGEFLGDIVTDTSHVWRAVMDSRRIVAAVARGSDDYGTEFRILEY
ncbi:SCF ubiquitin ligase complex subunit cdc4 [Nowakowskiella sp. JEL0407]|nr:SCF ubiquitin ligase complex subunit cdc4 [Nowakowskiella sp. JEL0407]